MPLSRETVQVEFKGNDRISSALTKISAGVNRVTRSLGALAGRSIVSGISSITSSLTSLVGVGGVLGAGGAAAGFALLTRSGLEAGDALAKVSDRVGITTEGFGRLNFAVSQTSEVSEQGLGASLQRLEKRLAEVSAGYGTASRAVRELGLDSEALVNAGTEEAFLQVADAISQVESAAQRVRLTDLFFGREGVGLLTTIDEGRARIEAMGDQAERLGLTFDRISLGRIEAANDAFGRLQSVIRAAGVVVAVELSGRLQELTTGFLAFVAANGGIGELISRAFDVIGRKAQELGQFVAGILETSREIVDFISGVASRGDAEETVNRIDGSLASIRSQIDELKANPPGVISSALLGNADERINELEGRFASLSRQRAEAIESAAVELLEAEDRILAGATGGRSFTFGGVSFNRANQDDIDTARSAFSDLNEQLQSSSAELANLNDVATSGVSDNSAALAEQARENAQRGIQDLQASFDERFRIELDYRRSVEQLREQAIEAGLTNTSQLEAALLNRRNLELTSLESTLAEETRLRRQAQIDAINEDGAQRIAAVDLSGFDSLNTQQFRSVQQGAEAIRRIYDQELSEIRAAVNLPAEERAEAIAQARELRDQITDQLQADVRINAVISTVQSGLNAAGDILGSIGQVQQQGLNDDQSRLQERAQQITDVRSQLQEAIRAQDQAEIDSAKNRLDALTSLQRRDDALARSRFENYKRTQRAIAVVSTISAAVQVFQETRGDLFSRIAGMTAALAAGFAQVRAIDSQRFNSSSAGAGGGAAGGGQPSSFTQAQQAANNQTVAGNTGSSSRTVEVQLPRGGIWTTEMIVELDERLREEDENNNIVYRAAS